MVRLHGVLAMLAPFVLVAMFHHAKFAYNLHPSTLPGGRRLVGKSPGAAGALGVRTAAPGLAAEEALLAKHRSQHDSQSDQSAAEHATVAADAATAVDIAAVGQLTTAKDALDANLAVDAAGGLAEGPAAVGVVNIAQEGAAVAKAAAVADEKTIVSGAFEEEDEVAAGLVGVSEKDTAVGVDNPDMDEGADAKVDTLPDAKAAMALAEGAAAPTGEEKEANVMVAHSDYPPPTLSSMRLLDGSPNFLPVPNAESDFPDDLAWRRVAATDGSCPPGGRPFHTILTAQVGVYQEWQTKIFYYHFRR